MPEQGFPLWNQPFTDPRTGMITQAWRQFLLSLWERSGGSPGTLDFDILLLSGMGTAKDPTARADAQAAMLMALRAQITAQNNANLPQTVYMPLALGSGQVVIAPDGRLIPMVWGTL